MLIPGSKAEEDKPRNQYSNSVNPFGCPEVNSYQSYRKNSVIPYFHKMDYFRADKYFSPRDTGQISVKKAILKLKIGLCGPDLAEFSSPLLD